MGASDRTAEFRALVKEVQQSVPDAKRTRLSRHTGDGQKDDQAVINKEYLGEGYAIVSSVIRQR